MVNILLVFSVHCTCTCTLVYSEVKPWRIFALLLIFFKCYFFRSWKKRDKRRKKARKKLKSFKFFFLSFVPGAATLGQHSTNYVCIVHCFTLVYTVHVLNFVKFCVWCFLGQGTVLRRSTVHGVNTAIIWGTNQFWGSWSNL